MRQAFGLLALVLAATIVAPAAARTDCSAAEHAKAAKALTAFQKQRRAYLKKHTAKAYAKQVEKLKAAAACVVEPPPPPPPPPDTTPPSLTSAEVNGPTLTLAFSEPLAPGSPAFTVSVDGLAWPVSGATIADTKVTVTLRLAVDAGQAVAVAYTGNAIADVSGNAAAAFDTEPTNSSPAAPQPGAGSYAPSLPKPSFALNDSPGIDPWVGEWGPKTDPWWVPSTGTFHGLVVPVDFSDAPATATPQFYTDLFRANTKPWYEESSYGRLTFDLQGLDHWTRMANPIDSYALANCCPTDQIHAFFQELIAKLDPTVDFSHVDAVYAVAPQSAGPHMSILLWRRWPGHGIVADGHELLNGVVGNGNYAEGTAYYLAHYLVTHETGHMMGLSDVYGRECPTCPDTHTWVGAWSMMDTADNPAAEFPGWDKWLLGWLDPSQVRGVTAPGQSLEEVVSPLEEKNGVKLIVVPTSSTFLYALDVRQPIGEDAKLCDHGVLVYTVDATKMNASGTLKVLPAHADAPCGPISDAAYDIGAGEVSTFEDANVRVELLQAYPDGAYRVRVTRK